MLQLQLVVSMFLSHLTFPLEISLSAQDPVPTCEDTWLQTQDLPNTTTIMTQIFVFLDTTWPYQLVADYVNYVLQRININPYASSVTLLAASNGEVIVNTTNYLDDVYAYWNITTHSLYQPGLSLPIVLNKARDLAEQVMNTERTTSSLGGQSMIALVVPSPIAYVTDEDSVSCMRYFSYFNNTVPDLHFIYYAGGAVIRFSDFVWNWFEDLYPLSQFIPVKRASEPVIERIRKVPRRIVNPRCGGDWWSSSWGPNQMSQLIHMGATNFYRIAPNYFPGRQPLRFLKIQAQSAISFTLCTSRSVILPYRNGSATPAEVECGQAVTSGYSFDLTDACTNLELGQCPPLYFSVQAQTFGDIKQVHCKEPECQEPNQARFTIIVDNLSCNNGALNLKGCGMVLIMALLPLLLSCLQVTHFN